jgi:hypothetical protein
MKSTDHIVPWDRAEKYSKMRAAVDAILRSSDPRDRALVERHNKIFVDQRRDVTERGVSASSVHASTFMSNLSVQYANEEYIGERLMPVVSVDKLANQFPSYAKRDRLAAPDDSMQGRSRPNEIQESRSTDSYATKPYGLSNFVEMKTLQNQDAPFDELLDLQESLDELMAYRREKRIAALVCASGSYSGNTSAISAGQRWNTSAGGNPIKDILTAKRACWPGRGRGMTVGVCSYDVYDVLRTNPVILDALKYTERGGLASRKNIASLFELDELYVGKAREDTANEGQTASYSRIWTDVFAILRVATAPSIRNATFGYTLRFKGQTNARLRFKEDVGTSGGYEAWNTLDEVQKVIAGDTSFLLTTPI